MKKLLQLLFFSALLPGAFAQNSNCGSISPEILPTDAPIKLCEGVPTSELEMSLSSNLPHTEFFVVNPDMPADMGDAIVGISENGIFVPENIGLVYGQRFTVRPFACDLYEFRAFIDVILNNSSAAGVACCVEMEAEYVFKDFCSNLSLLGINSGEDVNNLNDVWSVLKAYGGNTGHIFSVEFFEQQILLLASSVGSLPENCQYNSEYCYALGGTEQLFELIEAPLIVEVDISTPDEITISSTISDGVLEYSIDQENWQYDNTIYNTPTVGTAYVREVNSECVREEGFENFTLNAELIYLKGIDEATTNLIYWATATEINSLGFGVERSEDGINFTEIGWVEGAGISQSLVEYQFRDRAPLTGTAYYRLAMHDISGRIDYSPQIIPVERNDTPGFSILSIGPNPSANMINISITNDDSSQVEYLIYDVMGRKVRHGTQNLEIGINNFRIDASLMGTGMYVFTAFKDDYVVSAYKFVMH